MKPWVWGQDPMEGLDLSEIQVREAPPNPVLEWRKVKCIDPRDRKGKKKVWISLLHRNELVPARMYAPNTVDILRHLVNPVSLVGDGNDPNIQVLNIKVADEDFPEQTLQYTVLKDGKKHAINKMMSGGLEYTVGVELDFTKEYDHSLGNQGPAIFASYEKLGTSQGDTRNTVVREAATNTNTAQIPTGPAKNRTMGRGVVGGRQKTPLNPTEVSKYPLHNTVVGEHAISPLQVSSRPLQSGGLGVGEHTASPLQVFNCPLQSGSFGVGEQAISPSPVFKNPFDHFATKASFAEVAAQMRLPSIQVQSPGGAIEHPLALDPPVLPPPVESRLSLEQEQVKANELERHVAEYNQKYPVEGPVLADDTPNYCICDGPAENGGFMIECSNGEQYCLKQWFHTECIGMRPEDVPEDNQKWFCTECVTGKLGLLKKPENAPHLVVPRPSAIPRRQWAKAAKTAAAKAKGKAKALEKEIKGPKRADPLAFDSPLRKRPIHPDLPEFRVMNSATHPTHDYNPSTGRLWTKKENADNEGPIQELRKEFPTREMAIQARDDAVKEVSRIVASRKVKRQAEREDVDRQLEELRVKHERAREKFYQQKMAGEKSLAEKGKGKLTIQTNVGPLSMSDPSQSNLEPWSADLDKSFMEEMAEDYNLTSLGSAKAALRPMGVASVSSTLVAQTTIRKKAKWSQEEEEQLINVVRKCVADGLKGEPMWEAAHPMLLERGVQRSVAGMKMMWCRGLREKTRIDERRRKDAENLRTAIQDGQTRPRGKGKGKARKTRRAVAADEEEQQLGDAILLSMATEKTVARKNRSRSV